MSWIYLIVAGLFEVAFTSCMGKVKETTGSEMYWWFTGFYEYQHVFADKGNASPAYWYGLCCMDRNRCGRNRIGRHTDFQGTFHYMEVIFYCNADRFDYRFESSISLKQKNRMPIDIDILFFYILNYLDYFFTSTITSVLSAS